VYYDLHKFGYGDINFIIHPEHYYMAARITRDGLWRVSYGEDTGLSVEECAANQPKKFEVMLPGNPKPEDYKLTRCSPYRIHQRCAEKFRVGRVLLAADAAHLCNPFGGLGLVGGLVDVGGLSDCLIGLYEGKADDSILDKYDEVRRKKWHELINPISSGNFQRMATADAASLPDTDPFMNMVKRANDDPRIKKELDASGYAICHDFKQYYVDHPHSTRF